MHLGELADVICGPFGSAITNKDYQESGIPLIRITNISGDGYMDYSDIIYISEELGNSLSRTQVSAGDIVISQRGSLGQCAIVDDTFPKLNISANIIAIKNPKGISAEFIRNYILSAVGQTLLERASSGQVQQKITTQDIANLLIPNNCNEEKLISIIERGHTEYESGISQANEYLSGMSDYILRRLSIKKISYKKRLCCGVKFADVIADKTFSAEYYHPERMEAIHTLKSNMDITAYKLSNIVDFYRDLVNVTDNDDYLGLASVESQTGELSGIHEKAAGQAFVYKKGDVLYGRLRPYLNKVLFAEKSGVCSTEFHVMRVINCEKVLPEYAAAILRSDLILSQTRHMMTGNTHPRISNDDVKNLYIPIPELAVQIEIVTELHNRRVQARRLKEEAELNWKAAKEQFEKELLGE